MKEPDCKFCEDTGFIITEHGGISSAAPCACNARRTLESARIPENYRNATFDSFFGNPRPDVDLRFVMRQIKNYADKYDRFSTTDKPGLLILGPHGAGKTHLAVAALRVLIQRGFHGLFFDYQNLLESIRGAYNETSGVSDRAAYSSALECEVLLLDDLGAQRVTAWVEDTVTSIITHRCNHRKPLIATTNLYDEAAGDKRERDYDLKSKYFLEERIGMRARSRLFEMCRVIKMPYIADYRVETNKVFGPS